MKAKRTREILGLLVVLFGLLFQAVAHAGSSGSGSAYGLNVNLNLLPLVGSPVTATLGPIPQVSGTAPPDFDQTQTVLSANVSIPSAATVGAGVITAHTISALGANSVTSTSEVNGLGVSIALANALSLTADTVTSSATAACPAGTLTPSGSSVLTNPHLTVLGLVNVNLDANPLPNTAVLPLVLNPLGVSIVLNEQVVTGDTVTVNAIHISVNGGIIGLLGVLNADIVVAHSQATMADCALPDLALHKTGPATATVGTPFDYVITLDNAGAAPTAGTITVTDNVPANLTINSLSAGAGFTCGAAGQVVTCTSTTSIPAGTSNVPVVTIHVTPNTAGPASNTATVSGGGDATPGNNTTPPVSTTVSAAPAPDLTLTLAGPATATVGTPFDYTLTLANVGTGPTDGSVITVTDTIPAGVTINSVTAGPGFSCAPPVGQTVTCTGTPIINAGQSGVLAATIHVTPGSAGNITNSGAQVSGGGDANAANNTAPGVSTQVNAAPAPDLIPTLTGPATATVGVPFNYTLGVSNIGDAASSGLITITDTIPAGLTIGTVTPAAGWSCTVAGQTVSCTSSNAVVAGGSAPVATITVTPTVEGPVSNQATVSGGNDSNSANNTSAPTSTQVNPGAAQPDLVIAKSGPASATVGVAFDYVITLSNVGAGPTSGNITVTDNVPAGLTINNVAPGANFACTTAGQTVQCTSTTAIAAGASGVGVATITVTPTGAGAISNSASVSGGGDSTPGNNTSPPVGTNVNPGGPNLRIQKSAPASVSVNTPFNYVLTLSNVGASATSGAITVSDNVPAGLTINSVVAGANFSCTAAPTNPVVCTSSTSVAAGALNVPAVTINVTATGTGAVTNVATVSGGGDTTPGDNSTPPVGTTVNPPGPNLVMQKTAPSIVTVGTPFDYVLSLSNTGGSPTSGTITVSDTLPAGITIQSVTAGPNFSCTIVSPITCTSSTAIAAGAANVLVVTIRVAPTGVGGLSNTATVSGGGDVNPGDNTSPPAGTTVNPPPGPGPGPIHVPAMSRELLIAMVLLLAGLAAYADRRSRTRR